MKIATHALLLLASVPLASSCGGPLEETSISEDAVGESLRPHVPVVGATSRVMERVLPNTRALYAYDYAPTVLRDGPLYRTWWCGTGPAGRLDWIFTSEAGHFDGRWSTPRPVFQPTEKDTFDGDHTCDPDVIKVDGQYIMYYGGLGPVGSGHRFTRIGIATSPDGYTWTRVSGDEGLLFEKSPANGETYGAGQPSVARGNGWYYMVYTTVWRPTPGATPRGGEFVIRSRDALFRGEVEERRPGGWTDVRRGSKGELLVARDHPLLGNDHVRDLAYLPDHGVFMTISGGDRTRLDFFDHDFAPRAARVEFESANMKEQHGVARNGDGTLHLADPRTYNVQMLGAYWSGVADRANIFYYDLGRQTFQLRLK